ncbi:MAG: DNA alkylation repair protein [Proteobacteria bacterium]|nr:DNA alkylation repair protein [Pseudomonadota bacterium]
MDKERTKLVNAIRAAARPAPRKQGAAYLGTVSRTLNVSTAELRAQAREWVRANEDAPAADVLRLCDGLFAGKTHQEKALGAIILSYAHAARRAASQKRIEDWLDDLHGWAEVDALCSNVFQYEEMLSDWGNWKALLNRLSRDANINKRRASLVLLTGPVRYSGDARLSALAFALVGRLRSERDILITKAVSWLLRNLTLRHEGEVAAYLEANEAKLPRVAVRETLRKLRTGTKSGKSARRR